MAQDCTSVHLRLAGALSAQLVIIEDKKWGDTERDLLYKVRPRAACAGQRLAARDARTPVACRPAGRLAALAPAQGLEKFGVGKWGDISAELLPRWDDQALRVKAARLMGSQSLARYVAWKGNR